MKEITKHLIVITVAVSLICIAVIGFIETVQGGTRDRLCVQNGYAESHWWNGISWCIKMGELAPVMVRYDELVE